METLLKRQVIFREYKLWFSSHSVRSEYDKKWGNTFYIHFAKEDYPNLKYPPLVEKDIFGRKMMGFDYVGENDLSALDWHGGITFYEETISVESSKTFVKAGCDYRHYMDDHWELDDNGELLLTIEAPEILKQFLEISKQRGHSGFVQADS